MYKYFSKHLKYKRLHHFSSKSVIDALLSNRSALKLARLSPASWDAYNKLFVLPVCFPIFPYNTQVTQIHPMLYQFLDEQNIRNIGAFVIKKGKQPYKISTMKFKEMFLLNQFKYTHDIPLAKKIYHFESTFSQNIFYDSTVLSSEEPSINLITNENDVELQGTLCRIQFQKTNENNREKIYMIMKGITRVQLIERVQFNKYDDTGTSSKEDPSKYQSPDFFTHAKTHPIKPDMAKFRTDPVSRKKFAQLLELFALVKEKIQVNTPDLITEPTHPSTMELICGYLALSPYFKKDEILKLYLTLPFHERLNLLYDYFIRYAESLETNWDQIEEMISQDSSEDHKMKQVYNFLKRYLNQPASPFVEKIIHQMKDRKFPKNIEKILKDELNQIRKLPERHPEFNLKRNYIELLVSLPFGKISQDNFSITKSAEILSQTHFGMDKVKSRVLEFLAVSKLRKSSNGRAILLVGPPGVGKTSIASSIAKCLNRQFFRISLGGENDVAIIKGHRRTYMASYPGKIAQALKQCQTENPVILLDEIDKLGRSFRGSISDALLEVLDIQQNHAFMDNYLDVPLDLSKVLFICSANLLDTIPPALLDRMEMINLSGYTDEDKKQIASKHLIPKLMKETGLDTFCKETPISEQGIQYLITYYCRESGVRSLQRILQQLFEKVVMQVVLASQTEKKKPKLKLNIEDINRLLGPAPFSDIRRPDNIPGLGVGLAYNEYGGSLMYIEIVKQTYQQKSKDEQATLKYTGQLGQTIQESIEIAYTYAKKVLHQKFKNNFLEENDLHIHFPAGAVQKDGPSGGIAIASALISLAIGKPIKRNAAMTGEISLTGKILKIGGLMEKILASKREGITEVIIPEGNRDDYEKLPKPVKDGIRFHFVGNYKEVLNVAFDLKN